MKLNYIKELDGVRGIAALMVMFFHFFQAINADNIAFKLIQKASIFGQTGVTLFFVLSGFLITRILLASRQSNSYFSTFYIRRSLRIFPLYYLFLIIYFFVVPMFKQGTVYDANHTWYFWVYLQNFAFTFKWPIAGPNHFWSLAVEEHFYLFWPFVIYFFNIEKLKLSIYALIGIAFLCRWSLLQNGYGVFYFTFTNIDALAIGALLAVKELENKLTVSSFPKYRNLSFIFGALLAILWTFTSGMSSTITQLIKFPILSFFYYYLLATLIISRGNWKSIFNTKSLQFSGKISYGLYVYHPLCFELCRHYFNLGFIANFTIAFLSSYLLAFISYSLFEVQFIKLKKYFDYKHRTLNSNITKPNTL